MEKVWLSHYPNGIKPTIDGQTFASLADFFTKMTKRYQHRKALSSMNTVLTYAEFAELSYGFAAYLQQRLQFQPGSRIAIMLPNCLQYPIAIFGSLLAGGIVVNVNPLYTASELKHQLTDCEADTIVVVENFAHVLAEVLPETTVRHIIVTGLGDLLSFPKSYLVNAVVRHIKRMVPAWDIQQAIRFSYVLARGKRLKFQPVALDATDVAFLQYTGGTTGVAKGAILTHGNMVANLEQASSWIAPFFGRENEIIVTALPLYHIFALLANLLTFMKLGAMNLLITNPRDLKQMIAAMRAVPFTAITGVNTLFNAMIHHPDFASLDFSRLRLALGGGMALQDTVAQEWQRITGAPLLGAYGLSETSPAVTISPLSMRAYNGSVGLPLASTEIDIRDEDGQSCGIDVAGELFVRGPQVMRGYWNRPDETKLVLDDQGWFATGDIAKLDDKGYVYIVDRKKDLILVSGFNVYPNEVEEVLVKHTDVLEAAVIGVSDEEGGEKVKAFIVPKGAHANEEDILQHCRQYLTRYKVPKVIVFRDELPKTNVGKILRRVLKP